MKIQVYADGSATTMDGPGGYGYAIVIDGKLFSQGSGGIEKATNNVAEITAAIEGLNYVSGLKNNKDSDAYKDAEVELVCDSQLVLKYATGEYKCRKYHLVPLNIKLRKLFNELKATTRWVRGHSGEQYNELCDKLAKSARESQIALSSGT